jgi:hypothetical protein
MFHGTACYAIYSAASWAIRSSAQCAVHVYAHEPARPALEVDELVSKSAQALFDDAFEIAQVQSSAQGKQKMGARPIGKALKE